LQVLDVTENELGPSEFSCAEKVLSPITSKSKRFYEFLITKMSLVSKFIAAFGLEDITV